MIKTLYVNGDSWTFGQELKDDTYRSSYIQVL